MNHLARLTLLAALAFPLSSCDRGTVALPEPDTAPVEEETKPAAQAQTKTPALTEAAIESLILDALSPTGEETTVAATDPEKFSIQNLSEAQRKTLNDAMQKAVSQIDFKTLLSSLASNLNIKGLDLANLPDNASITTRVLTPEEVEKMGIDIKGLTGKAGAGNVSIGSVQTITIGVGENSPLAVPKTEDADDGNTPGSAQLTVTEISPIDATEKNDPERAARFQSRLESGDSDALASEIANLIQTGIDAATLQQAMGGVIDDRATPEE